MFKKVSDIVIAWGVGLFDIKSGKDITHNVTGIYVDSYNSICTVIIQKGTDVDTIKISMEYAQEIGFININALKPYCK